MTRQTHEDEHDLRHSVPFIALVSLGIILAASAAVPYFMLRGRTVPPTVAIAAGAKSPAPRLQPDPAADATNYLAFQRRLLSTGAWVDYDAGIVRIPLDEAMVRYAAGERAVSGRNRRGQK